MSRETDNGPGFLLRWSQRKRQQDAGSDSDSVQPHEPSVESNEHSAADSEMPPQTERPLPIWQQEDVDAETKKAALRKLFRKPEFNIRDGLNEYDDDFTQFASLGNIVTHEMKRMLKLAEEKTRPDEANQEKTQSSSAAEHTEINPSDKEDDGIV
ncbi:DUF3306 domain-containing protein [Methylophaga thiooxydans]|uniref:DUF3306 domain-containing protein n=1 Tax=Methylophaga thiooxydans TaxID=392484 RepID=UPI002356BE22|nr:DUF3306 domain-containing protein [Methylophaga thiooxydans]